MERKEQNNIHRIKWPPQRLNLNPTENLWRDGMTKRSEKRQTARKGSSWLFQWHW